MPINDPTAPVSGARQIRWQLIANGAVIPGCVRAEVHTNSHHTAGSWSAEMAGSADPDRTAPWWHAVSGTPSAPVNTPPASAATAPGTSTTTTNTDITVEIQVSDDAGATFYPSLIQGRLDKMDFDPISNVLRIDGRDRVADLAETKTFETYKNKTSSEVVQAIAAEHGFTANVTSTTTLTGRFYTQDHDIASGPNSRATPEWDLLVYLAEHEGYDLYFTTQPPPNGAVGQTTAVLNFQPATQISDDPWIVLVDLSGSFPVANAIDIHLTRNFTLARDVRVVVSSFHSKKGAGFKVTAPASSSTSSVKAGKTQQYVFFRPNLTQAAAQALANRLYTELTQHERVFTFSVPGTVDLTPRNVVRLDGTQTDWDQVYFVSDVTHVLSEDDGWRMDLTCKNQSPAASEVVA